jgi:hypothetical protein
MYNLHDIGIADKSNGNVYILILEFECLEYQDQYLSQVGVMLKSNGNVYILAVGLECWEDRDQYSN